MGRLSRAGWTTTSSIHRTALLEAWNEKIRQLIYILVMHSSKWYRISKANDTIQIICRIAGIFRGDNFSWKGPSKEFRRFNFVEESRCIGY